MKGGIVLFRGHGSAARRYVESDHSRADDYYLQDEGAVATRLVSQGVGLQSDELDGDSYQNWVDWKDPETGQMRGKPRQRRAIVDENGVERVYQSSPMFAEMTINVPKSLSLAAELDEAVSKALDAAQEEAGRAMHQWVAAHCGTRVGPKGAQRVAFAQRFESVMISHRTSRAGDPHRHIHLQFSTRLFAEGAWRALDTAVLFRQQGLLRSLGEAKINTNSQLQEALAAAGFTFDPTTGNVKELEKFVPAMSKRRAQRNRAYEELLAEWKAEHGGAEPGRAARAALDHLAWAADRPEKKTRPNATKEGWKTELENLGYVPPQKPAPADLGRTLPAPFKATDTHIHALVDDVVAGLESQGSTWSKADIEGWAYSQIITGRYGTIATAENVDELAATITKLATARCQFMIDKKWQEVANDTSSRLYTTQHVIDVDVEVRTKLFERAEETPRPASQKDLEKAMANTEIRLDEGQQAAARAVAGSGKLVVVEGAAGAGKTTMLKAATTILTNNGRTSRILTPTLKAAQAAAKQVGTEAGSIAKLLHAHGYRWDDLGRWTHLQPGQIDPATGTQVSEIPPEYQLQKGQTLIIDEAGMVDVDTMRSLLELADQEDVRIVMVGDRAQLPAVGRGGVLDAAVEATRLKVDMSQVHRFVDEQWTDLTLRLRSRDQKVIPDLFNSGNIRLNADQETAQKELATTITKDLAAGKTAAAIVSTNEEAAVLSSAIQEEMIRAGLLTDSHVYVTLADENPARRGDLIQIRENNKQLGVTNRQLLAITGQDQYGNIKLRTPGTSTHQRTILVPPEFLHSSATLGYALTAHGVQGETLDAAYTLAGDAMDASGLYVGATRGRQTNHIHIIAASQADASDHLARVLSRDNADRGVFHQVVTNRENLVSMYAPATPYTGPETQTGNLTRRQTRNNLGTQNEEIYMRLSKVTTPDQARQVQKELLRLQVISAKLQDAYRKEGNSRAASVEARRYMQTKQRIDNLTAQTSRSAAPARSQTRNYGRDL
ncbi:hypothetical protein ACU21_01540 [Actinobaculum suis]|uniref:MobF family relaxase n=1 Tax=Actinobaculum suis TaxID=1657 RepID=UPI00080873EB|nr:MobF family relaxase [Actinobaculum suis]OCA93157.1 hypothetical protein ACU21_01540 [Actinobaculum suis]